MAATFVAYTAPASSFTAGACVWKPPALPACNPNGTKLSPTSSIALIAVSFMGFSVTEPIR